MVTGVSVMPAAILERVIPRARGHHQASTKGPLGPMGSAWTMVWSTSGPVSSFHPADPVPAAFPNRVIRGIGVFGT